jgi:hypothetical protein
MRADRRAADRRAGRAVTRAQHAAIRAAYLAGDTVEQIAAAARASVAEVDIYLTAWCGAGCPEEGAL